MCSEDPPNKRGELLLCTSRKAAGRSSCGITKQPVAARTKFRRRKWRLIEPCGNRIESHPELRQALQPAPSMNPGDNLGRERKIP